MEEISKNIGKTIITIVVILFLLVGLVVYAGSYKFDLVVFTSDEVPQEDVNYGSVGTEKIAAVPYWIWLMLPRVFPEYLPDSGGYVALGVTWEAGAELPVGFSKKTIALSSLYYSDRQTRVNPSLVVDQEASSNFDLQGYSKFLADCAKDPRFKPGYILKEINDYYYKLSPWEKQLYRFIVIPKTKEQLQV